MKKSFLLMLGWLAASLTATAGTTAVQALSAADLCPDSVRQEFLLRDWSFFLGDPDGAAQPGFDDRRWQTVRIPHDWAIYGPFDKEIDKQTVAIEQNGEKMATEKTGRTGSLPYIGVGWYRTRIPAGKSFDGRRVVLTFDGAMSQAQVYVNGQKVGEWPYGYNTFYFDIADYLAAGDENLIAVRLENVGESSRWYPGAGLYRHVRLTVTRLVSVDVWGTWITTPVVDSTVARVNVKTRISCPEGTALPGGLSLQTELLAPDGTSKACHTETLQVNGEFEQSLAVPQPLLWSPESPSLYRAVTRLYDGDRLLDRCETRFGIRSIAYNATDGFLLNGQPVKIKGVCLHHDLGPLGAAVNRSAMERQLRILKEMGCNAIRSSHNMPSPEQVELCDELGLMMMAESFDEWAGAKCRNGYNRFFGEWVEKDVENLVVHYRNHPSIVMWSAGNEVPDQWNERGIKDGFRLQALFHRLDPTRPVTMGMDQVSRTIKNGFAAYWDIPGLNYRLPLYGEAHTLLPQGYLLGSETASTISSRGVYKLPVRELKGQVWPDLQCSSYDVEACWWSNVPDDDWLWQDDNPWVLGEFVWTGFDYLGEPTPYDDYWPSRSSYFGICDLAGLPKDRYFLYRSRWNTGEHTLHILPHWNWEGQEGDTVPVFVYTDCPSAELFINGQSQGRLTKNPAGRLDRYRLMWMNTLYEPGTVEAVAYDAQGNEVMRKALNTAGKPHHLELQANRIQLPAQADELAFVTVRVVDAQGNLCPLADNQLQFKVKGAGRFRAACNGDATSTEPFHLPTMKAFNGQLVVLLQSDGTEGTMELSVSGRGLKPAVLSLECVAQDRP